MTNIVYTVGDQPISP